MARRPKKNVRARHSDDDSEAPDNSSRKRQRTIDVGLVPKLEAHAEADLPPSPTTTSSAAALSPMCQVTTEEGGAMDSESTTQLALVGDLHDLWSKSTFKSPALGIQDRVEMKRQYFDAAKRFADRIGLNKKRKVTVKRCLVFEAQKHLQARDSRDEKDPRKLGCQLHNCFTSLSDVQIVKPTVQQRKRVLQQVANNVLPETPNATSSVRAKKNKSVRTTRISNMLECLNPALDLNKCADKAECVEWKALNSQTFDDASLQQTAFHHASTLEGAPYSNLSSAEAALAIAKLCRYALKDGKNRARPVLRYWRDSTRSAQFTSFTDEQRVLYDCLGFRANAIGLNVKFTIKNWLSKIVREPERDSKEMFSLTKEQWHAALLCGMKYHRWLYHGPGTPKKNVHVSDAGMLLCDEVGLGKTFAALASLAVCARIWANWNNDKARSSSSGARNTLDTRSYARFTGSARTPFDLPSSIIMSVALQQQWIQTIMENMLVNLGPMDKKAFKKLKFGYPQVQALFQLWVPRDSTASVPESSEMETMNPFDIIVWPLTTFDPLLESLPIPSLRTTIKEDVKGWYDRYRLTLGEPYAALNTVKAEITKSQKNPYGVLIENDQFRYWASGFVVMDEIHQLNKPSLLVQGREAGTLVEPIRGRSRGQDHMVKAFTLGLSATPTGADMTKLQLVMYWAGIKNVPSFSLLGDECSDVSINEGWKELKGLVQELRVAGMVARVFSTAVHKTEQMLFEFIRDIGEAERDDDGVKAEDETVEYTGLKRDCFPHLIDVKSTFAALSLLRGRRDPTKSMIDDLHVKASKALLAFVQRDDQPCLCGLQEETRAVKTLMDTLRQNKGLGDVVQDPICVCQMPAILRRSRNEDDLEKLNAYTVRLQDNELHQQFARRLDERAQALLLQSDLSAFSSQVHMLTTKKNVNTEEIVARLASLQLPSEMDENQETSEEQDDSFGSLLTLRSSMKASKVDSNAYRLSAIHFALVFPRPIDTPSLVPQTINGDSFHLHSRSFFDSLSLRIALRQFDKHVSMMEEMAPIILSLEAITNTLNRSQAQAGASQVGNRSQRVQASATMQNEMEQLGSGEAVRNRELRSLTARVSRQRAEEAQQMLNESFQRFGIVEEQDSSPQLAVRACAAGSRQPFAAEIGELYGKLVEAREQHELASLIIAADDAMAQSDSEHFLSSLHTAPSAKISFIVAWHLAWQRYTPNCVSRFFPKKEINDVTRRVKPRALKTIISVEHVSVLMVMASALQIVGIKFESLSDTDPEAKRRWTECEEMCVLLIQRRHSCGLNLQNAEVMFMLQLLSNEEENRQMAGRIYRQGQKNPTYIFRLVRNGSGDERALQLQSSKVGMRALLEGTARHDWIQPWDESNFEFIRDVVIPSYVKDEVDVLDEVRNANVPPPPSRPETSSNRQRARACTSAAPCEMEEEETDDDE